MLRVYHIIVAVLLAGTAVPVALHHRVHGVYDADQLAIAFFLWLNFIIALWELCLFFRIDHIRRQHERYKADYKGRELQRAVDFFTTPVPLRQLLSPTLWSDLWASYSVFDDSYADRRSYGFFIDVGNGFSTLLPTLFCIYGMTYAWVSPRVLGVVLLLLNYQMWYGTLVYFASFLFNKRHVEHTRLNLVLFVGFTNGLWFTFPLWGMWAALQLLWTNSYAVFR